MIFVLFANLNRVQWGVLSSAAMYSQNNECDSTNRRTSVFEQDLAIKLCNFTPSISKIPQFLQTKKKLKKCIFLSKIDAHKGFEMLLF